ncbi:hypothetical protein DFQ01_103244 [Paenibacillus cellulosilyticus]|uniref:Uncharacterized protein n=1 Tax=Paenibacillus cellulosilyticus TaxID=375489 RepID=A0A2V2YX67_9BACL|nr:hypothetical protein [Paenibacillus cellulosilyticus]PWW06342.1 hypothetical protein DFQ01_103244 [Paenibacillus cellulosilyticus]QKS43442.1 hypothetical protein HUB94_02650 [Paenibacillus cellulosilyticus]QKS46306.1 hypothetical protein HUB94_19015 [Paenibacillus cellulosilyticus]
MKARALLELVVDTANPVEEIQACIATISLQHGPKQLQILKDIEMWLSETIIEMEIKQSSLEKPTNQDMKS